MSASDKPERGADEARHHLRKRVNEILRRPGMYGGDEMVERLALEAMAAVDGCLERWWAECGTLRGRGAFTEAGVPVRVDRADERGTPQDPRLHHD